MISSFENIAWLLEELCLFSRVPMEMVVGLSQYSRSLLLSTWWGFGKILGWQNLRSKNCFTIGNLIQYFFQNLPMLSIFLTTESAMIAKTFLRITKIRPRPGILLTLIKHRLENDSSLKVEQLKSGLLFVTMFWLDRKLVFLFFSLNVWHLILSFTSLRLSVDVKLGLGIHSTYVRRNCHVIVLLINECKCKKWMDLIMSVS